MNLISMMSDICNNNDTLIYIFGVYMGSNFQNMWSMWEHTRL